MIDTKIIKIDKNNIDINKIRYAGEILKNGGLVAFPTETVYGLGADALNENAVKKIFEAKGRPGDNPLIVHIENKALLDDLVRDVPICALKLMDKFWPGPLTIVVKKNPTVPNNVTGGLDTVAIRIPANPVALALLKESGLAVAAPSANISGRPSPTNASHVIEDLYGKVDIIIDGGSSNVGLESTVIDVTQDIPMILRPGGIDIDMILEVLPKAGFDPTVLHQADTDIPKAPGMKYKHYAPSAEVIVIQGELSKIVQKINELLKEYSLKGINAAVLASSQTKDLYETENVVLLGDREELGGMAKNLFASLRYSDKMGVSILLAEAVESKGIGTAIMNRISKAAGFNIIKV